MALIVAVVAFSAAWAAQDWRHGERYTALQLAHETAQRTAQARHRQREHELQDEISKIDRDAHSEKQRLETALAAARAGSDGLQRRLSDLSRKYHSAATASEQCATELSAARLFADLLGEAERLASEYAAEADRARLAGTTCERAYETISDNKR